MKKVSILVLGLLAYGMSAFAQNDLLWKKNFGGSYYDYYLSVTAVSDGIVAVGYSASASFGNGDWEGVTGKGGRDAIIVKYDNIGNVLWKKNFGGSSDDYYRSVTAVSDGVVAVGYSGFGSFGNGDLAGVMGKGIDDAIIVKYDNAGNVVWKKNFGGSNVDIYNSVTAVSDGVVAVGFSYPNSFGNGDWKGVSGKGGYDAIIVKYDNIGNVVWKKNFGGSYWDVYGSVTEVSDGVVAMGYSDYYSFGNGDWVSAVGKGGEDAIIVKYDNVGNVVWKKNFGGSDDDRYESVTMVSDGVVAVGYSASASFGNGDWEGTTGKGGGDAIITKYDNVGNVVWKKNFGGNSGDRYYSVTMVSDGVVAVGYSGYYSFGNGDWVSAVGKGGEDAIIVKYDNAGNVVWKKNFGGSDEDRYESVTTVSGNIVAVGVSYPASFGNGDWKDVAGKGNDDAIIVKYGGAVGITDPVREQSEITIYPNPTSGKVWVVENDGMTTITNIDIFDMMGRYLRAYPCSRPDEVLQLQIGTSMLDISSLPSGVYFIRIQTDEGVAVRKVVKE